MRKPDGLTLRQSNGDVTRVAIIGAGYVASGVVHVLSATPSVVPALIVNRTPSRAVSAFHALGVAESDVLISNDIDALGKAIKTGQPAVTENYALIGDLPIELVIEATGAIDYGAAVILHSLDAGKNVISYNAEVDSLFASEFHRRSIQNNVVYTIADGDQPGALLRLREQVEMMGFDITAMINCKRHLNVYQNPETGAGYSARDTVSAHMTTSFGDGTKMQIEQSVVANACSMTPVKRGMIGIESMVEHAARDIASSLPEGRFVEYTLAGDFAAGVGIMCRHENYDLHKKALKMYKMGDGPDYFIFRPFHLVHLELPYTLRDVIIDANPLGFVDGAHSTEVVAMAKKPLSAGEKLDCIGGFSAYGLIASSSDADGFLPMCLIEYATMTAAVEIDQPVPLSAVTFDTSISAVQLWLELQKQWKRNAAFLQVMT